MHAYISYNDIKKSKVQCNLSKITINFWTVCTPMTKRNNLYRLMKMPLTELILKNEALERLWIAGTCHIMQNIQLGMCICLIYLIVIWEVVFGDVKAKRLFNLVWISVMWNSRTYRGLYIVIGQVMQGTRLKILSVYCWWIRIEKWKQGVHWTIILNHHMTDTVCYSEKEKHSAFGSTYGTNCIFDQWNFFDF